MIEKINKNKPGYKHTSLGWIPEEWEVGMLGDLINIISGDSPSNYDLMSFGKYPYLKVEDLNNSAKYQVLSREYSNEEKNIVPKLSTIFPKRGAAIMNNKVRINSVPVQMDSNLMSIYPTNGKLNNEFLYYKIKQIALYKIADTSTIPQINNKHIFPIKFEFPPLPEQQKIAAILSTWDEAIAKTQQLIAQLQQRNKGLMQQLLTGKKRLKGFEEMKRYKLNADEIFKPVSIKNNGNEQLLSATQDKGIIPRTMLEGRVTMPSGETNSYKLVEPGDFIISLRSFQGGLEYSEYRGIVSPAYTVIKPIKPIDNSFYKYYFKSHDFIGHLAVAVIGIRDGKQISFDDFCVLRLPYPPIEEQKAIAGILNKADGEVKLNQQKLSTLQQQKKGLMQKLLTGEVRVKVEHDFLD